MYTTVETSALLTNSFEAIYQEHRRRVFSLCRYLLNSVEAAEDATHETFLRAKRQIATYDPSLPISSWLLTIASNHCIDLLRRRRLEGHLFDLNPGPDFEPASRLPSPLTELLAAERGNTVRDALALLPDKFRIPLVLAYYNELSYDEIAGMLGLKRNHVATLIFRAKQQMRKMLTTEETQNGLS